MSNAVAHPLQHHVGDQLPVFSVHLGHGRHDNLVLEVMFVWLTYSRIMCLSTDSTGALHHKIP